MGQNQTLFNQLSSEPSGLGHFRYDAFGTWGCTTSVHGDFGTYDDYFGT